MTKDESPCDESPCDVRLNPVRSTSDLDDLGSEIIGLAGRLAAATCRWLLLVARFDEGGGCARAGLASTTAWLSHYCGLSRRTANDHVRVARALAAFTPLADAMSSGRLSYSHVRAISRVVRPGDDALVGDLINVAEQGSVGQLESLVRGYRIATRADGDGPDQQRLTMRWDDDSYWRLSARLDPETGPVVESAISSLMKREQITAPQALARIAEIALVVLADAEQLPRLRTDEQAAVVVHLNAETARSAERVPASRIEDGPGLPEPVMRRLICAGRVRTVVHNRDGSVLDVGRSHRLVTKRQYRALLLGRRCCEFPGCESRIGLEAHHIQHWLDGGRTDLRNLLLLCRRHHHAYHDGVFSIERSSGNAHEVRFRRADGTLLPRHVDPSPFVAGSVPVEDEHSQVAANAATTRWDGTRLDRDYAVACLAASRHSSRLPRAA